MARPGAPPEPSDLFRYRLPMLTETLLRLRAERQDQGVAYSYRLVARWTLSRLSVFSPSPRC